MTVRTRASSGGFELQLDLAETDLLPGRLVDGTLSISTRDDKTIRAVSHVFELMEMAWHDCYAEISPSEDVVDDVLLCSGGTIGGLVTAAHLAVIDRRDLSVWASDLRSDAGGSPN